MLYRGLFSTWIIILLSCSNPNKLLYVNVYSNLSNVNKSLKLEEQVYYNRKGQVDSIVYYNKENRKLSSVVLTYNGINKLIKQVEKFYIDTLTEDTIHYTYSNEGILENATANSMLFFNANEGAILKIKDSLFLLDKVCYDIQKILLNISMFNNISDTEIVTKVKSINKKGLHKFSFPCKFNRVHLYSQFNFLPDNFILDSIYIEVLNNQLIKFYTYYENETFIKQDFKYKSNLLTSNRYIVQDSINSIDTFYFKYSYENLPR